MNFKSLVPLAPLRLKTRRRRGEQHRSPEPVREVFRKVDCGVIFIVGVFLLTDSPTLYRRTTKVLWMIPAKPSSLRPSVKGQAFPAA